MGACNSRAKIRGGCLNEYDIIIIGIMGVRLNEYERLFGVSPFNVCKYAPTGTGAHGDDVIVYAQ